MLASVQLPPVQMCVVVCLSGVLGALLMHLRQVAYRRHIRRLLAANNHFGPATQALIESAVPINASTREAAKAISLAAHAEKKQNG